MAMPPGLISAMRPTMWPSPQSGPPTGALLRLHHGGAEGDGRLAAAVRDSHRGHAIDRGVLDGGVRHPGAGGFRGVPDQCAGYEEPAGAQDGRAGESMADEVAHLWTGALVPGG